MNRQPSPGNPETLLVVPVWNDADRFEKFGPQLAAALAAGPDPIRCIVADDGSTPAGSGKLDTLVAELAAIYPGMSVHHANAHRGKGSVIREAWGLAPDAGWLAFADADGSVSAGDMLGLVRRAIATDSNVIATRVSTANTRIEATFRRKFLHRAYLRLAKAALGLDSADLQCGAKVLRGADYRRAAPSLRENGWAFDTELLARFHRLGITWDEVPVNWTACGGGKVKPLRDACDMLRALRRIRDQNF